MDDWFKKWQKRMRKKNGSLRRGRAKRTFPWEKALMGLGIFILAAILGTIALFAWYARDLPQPGKVVRREGFATRIYDRNQKLLYDIYQEEKRTPVSLNQIPQALRQATIAIEDKEFYQHKGFSLQGIARAFYNIIFHHQLQGGSTLTQQLVKNVLLTSERTLERKIKEFILAIQIEARFSKDQILEMYLNEVPYGGNTRGVEAASELYFGKPVSQLTLTESAILAGLPQGPTAYSPFGANPEAYKERTKHVLRRMEEDGYITSEQRQQAEKELDQVQFAARTSDFAAPHFVMFVKQLLVNRYGEEMVENGGLKVTTSLDLDLQEEAEKIVAEELEKVVNLNITNGAVIVLDPVTGEILAMVGSRDYNEPNFGKVNVVTQGLRQPGSAIKPVTYVTALKKGYTAAHLLLDTKTEFPGASKEKPYIPVNYDGKYHGPVLMRPALGNSLNVPAVKMLAQVGLENMLETAYEMGFTTLKPTAENLSKFGLAVTLGGGEVRLIDMASAYSAFANGGLKIEPTAILKVENQKGEVLEEFKPTKGKQVLTQGEAFIISDILSDNNARLISFGANSLLNIPGRQVAVKTGTTNNMKDNWAVGWTPQVLVGVWVGNNDNSSMKQVASGISGASPIWRRVIMAALDGKPNVGFTLSEEVVKMDIDVVSGQAAHDGFPSRPEYFLKGTQPQGEDKVHVLLKICRDEGKLATPEDVASGNYEEKEFFVFNEGDPFADYWGGENRWQKGIDEWVAAQEDPRYHPPKEYCQGGELAVRFKKPKKEEEVNNKFEVEIEVDSLEKVEWVKIWADDQEKETFTSPPYRLTLVLPDGPHRLKAKVRDVKGREKEREIKIGVNVPWDWQAPTPTPLSSPTLAPSPTPSLVPTPIFSPTPTP
ncbi:PBP1A family penicillin-binding protein [Candidatus Shapirobacteria bacterium]|nr:PBP1A family penicillin-binding protein [Candidatus Shapirobacteria bacterium]